MSTELTPESDDDMSDMVKLLADLAPEDWEDASLYDEPQASRTS